MKKLLITFLSILFVISITGCVNSADQNKLIQDTIGLNDMQSLLLQQSLEKNGVKSQINKIESITENSYELTCGKKVYTLILTENNIVNKIITPESELLFLNIDSLPIPEANTTEALDYIFAKAKEDAKSATSEDAELAYLYISDTGSSNVADLFADNKTMEKCMYYGTLLQLKYVEKNEKLSVFGSTIVDFIQGVYLGTEKMTDKTVQDKLSYVGGAWSEASDASF